MAVRASSGRRRRSPFLTAASPVAAKSAFQVPSNDTTRSVAVEQVGGSCCGEACRRLTGVGHAGCSRLMALEEKAGTGPVDPTLFPSYKHAKAGLRSDSMELDFMRNFLSRLVSQKGILSRWRGTDLQNAEIAELKKKVAAIKPTRPPFYDNLRMFTYFLDRDFPIEQKKWFLERQCFRGLGYFPNIDNPQTFNEKTQWYKLYYRDPLMTKCIDKHAFKDHITEVLGAEYVVPLLGAWDRAVDVDFESLPNAFALKSNWGSGSRHVLLVRDKSKLNVDETRARINNWVQPWENVYYHTFDWGYKDIQPKIIAEKLITNKHLEYKFFCFNGEPKFLYVATDSSPGMRNTHNYYDMEWNLLPFTRHAKNAKFEIPMPENFDEMVRIARTLSAPFPHVRVDLCQTSTGLLVEELTFYVGSGTGRFSPREWDLKFGEPFILPERSEP